MSQLFYGGNSSFPARESALLNTLRKIGVLLVTLVLLTSLSILLLKLIFPHSKPLVDLRAPLFLLGTCFAGPLLFVNWGLKDYWGRPRPFQTEVFGGSAPFASIWPPTNICPENCSFVSGEASSAFWLFGLVFITPKHWRMPLGIGIGVLCLVLSVNRIAFGRHFLSDILLAWGLNMIFLLVGYAIVYKLKANWNTPQALDNLFSRLGVKLHYIIPKAIKSAGKRLRVLSNKYR